MIEAELMVETDDGSMGTFVVHPDTVPDSRAALPVVVFLMDAPGKRPLLHDMARTIAERGYYVMLPNLYYRTTDTFQLDFASKESFAQMSEMMMALGNKMVGRDVAALFAHADADPVADASAAGVVGYCMSGPFAIWAAAEHANRVKAAASFYGVRLHAEKPDSPHLRLGEIAGEIYVGAAEHDDYVALDEIDRFEAAMQLADVAGRVERYWGTYHGFAFDDRPAYDAAADRRHWVALFELFDRKLKPS